MTDKPITKLILETDEDILVGLVMLLTGGRANPSVVRGHIRRVRDEEGHSR